MGSRCNAGYSIDAGKYNDDDDDVYLMNYNMAMGYKIYLHTNTDQPERHKYKMKSIRKMLNIMYYM
jgi:hypothetical protein